MNAVQPAGLFGCNSYSYVRSEDAETCLARLAGFGFREFELMVHPGHLWPSEWPAERRSRLRAMFERDGLTLTTLNMPNVDINVAGAAQEMRNYSLRLLIDTVRLAGEVGARGVVIGPGKPNPLFPASVDELTKHFYQALDLLAPIAESSGTALWLENMPFAYLPAVDDMLTALDRYGNPAIGIVYDIANAWFIGEDFAGGLKKCGARLKLVHLSDTNQTLYRHDAVGMGNVPFAQVPAALAAVCYTARPMLEIISHNADRDNVASAEKLAALGLGHTPS
jgi:sugar phosphate isomerase/epimerase